MFEITFEMYIKPTMREKRLIFKNTNEKQEKVASNLLMWFREKLNILNEKEQNYHPLVSLLNSDSCSLLKDRIIMGAEKKNTPPELALQEACHHIFHQTPFLDNKGCILPSSPSYPFTSFRNFLSFICSFVTYCPS